MYSVLDYGHMIADPVRMDAYAAALRRVVRPGSTVLDVGTGTGIFAMLACQLGAARVYAVDPCGAIAAAREIAEANGFAERIHFLDERIEDVALPERVDVMISDMRGALPFDGVHLRAIAGARERFLASDGVMIPLRDELWGAPVEAPELYAGNLRIFEANAFGLEMAEARRLVVNTPWSASQAHANLVAEPAHLATVDYGALDSPDLQTRARFRVASDGTAHGLLLWFDAKLAEGIGFSNAPGGRDTVYGRVCLPFQAPIALAAGDALAIDLDATLIGGDYVWSWNTEVRGSDPDAAPRLRFTQSSFFGEPLSNGHMKSFDSEHKPGLNPDGRIDRAVLDDMRHGMKLETIARHVARSFPDRFDGWEDALCRVRRLSATYGSR